MHAILKPFVDLCLLRSAPQALPRSDLLLALALGAHALSSALLAAFHLGAARAVLSGIAETALLAALTAVLLAVHHRPQRLHQTLTALTGSGALIGVVAMPIYLWGSGLAADGSGDGSLLVLLVLLAWSLVVTGHILRHAVSGSFILGLVLAVVFYWISVNALTTLFPRSG